MIGSCLLLDVEMKLHFPLMDFIVSFFFFFEKLAGSLDTLDFICFLLSHSIYNNITKFPNYLDHKCRCMHVYMLETFLITYHICTLVCPYWPVPTVGPYPYPLAKKEDTCENCDIYKNQRKLM
jgi:hypothetical protein